MGAQRFTLNRMETVFSVVTRAFFITALAIASIPQPSKAEEAQEKEMQVNGGYDATWDSLNVLFEVRVADVYQRNFDTPRGYIHGLYPAGHSMVNGVNMMSVSFTKTTPEQTASGGNHDYPYLILGMDEWGKAVKGRIDHYLYGFDIRTDEDGNDTFQPFIPRWYTDEIYKVEGEDLPKEYPRIDKIEFNERPPFGGHQHRIDITFRTNPEIKLLPRAWENAPKLSLDDETRAEVQRFIEKFYRDLKEETPSAVVRRYYEVSWNTYFASVNEGGADDYFREANVAERLSDDMVVEIVLEDDIPLELNADGRLIRVGPPSIRIRHKNGRMTLRYYLMRGPDGKLLIAK